MGMGILAVMGGTLDDPQMLGKGNWKNWKSEKWIETPIQTTALLRSARILRRVLERWEHLLSLGALVKDHQLMLVRNNNNNNDNNNELFQTKQKRYVVIPADHKVNTKEREILEKYLDLARELKKSYEIW